MPVQPRDSALTSRAREGDPAAWRELYAAIGGRLLVWLRSQPHLDPSLDHEDVAAETWCTAASRIADFEGDVDAFAGWLFGIARNHVLNTNRRAQRRATAPTDVDPREVAGASRRGGSHPDVALGSGYEQVEQLGWIRGLLARLPAREADVVACIDVVGLDVGATARALGLSSNAVRVAHHRALRRLRPIVAAEATQVNASPTSSLPLGQVL